jgi:hypothetical protein
MTTVYAWVAFAFVAAELSVTWMLKPDDPGVVGVPLILPVDAESVSPAGSEPEATVHV